MAVAHGSKDPRATATIAALVNLVRSPAADRGLVGLDVREAFLDHCAPSLAGALGRASTASRNVVLVPLLLSAAYHSKSDIPAQVAAAGATLPHCRVRQTATLGPHPLLIAGLERRLAQAAVVPGRHTSVVLAAAGSSDPQANEMVSALAARWQAAGRWRRVVPAYASASSPSPAEAVRALHARFPRHRVVVATYLLAPGYFADKIEAQALEAGAVAVSAPLGAIPEVANVIIERYEATLVQARDWLSGVRSTMRTSRHPAPSRQWLRASFGLARQWPHTVTVSSRLGKQEPGMPTIGARGPGDMNTLAR